MNYCDFSDLKCCREGNELSSRAQCLDGKWICDMCYYYYICPTFKDGEANPCRGECEHRPKLITKWVARRRR